MNIRNVAAIALCLLVLCPGLLCAQTEPPHPILTITGSGSGASTVLSTYTESQYTNYFVPHQPPRNDSYARRVAIALLDWARWFPDYYMTGKNSASFINTGPSYILASDLQRASDHNGLAHEWSDDELLAFDCIYDSVALTNLSNEL